MAYRSVAISSGHGLYVRGACGIIDEVDEARKVVERVAGELVSRGVQVFPFHDDTSQTQSQNLDEIVSFHNAQQRELDVSVHFNCYEQTDQPRGVEVLYYSEFDLADALANAMAVAGNLVDRGAKQRTDLKFLNSTEMPSVLLEVCFVDSEADCREYDNRFDAICGAIADVIGGPAEQIDVPVRPERPPISPPRLGRMDIEISGNVIVTINGEIVHSPEHELKTEFVK